MNIKESETCKCPCKDIQACKGLDAIRYDASTEDNDQHPQCKLCNGVVNALKQKFIESNVLSKLNEGKKKYKDLEQEGLSDIKKSIDTLHQKRALFEAQAHKIRALKQKIHVATEVLHTATGKLSHLSSSFNTLEQQNGLQYQDKVQVGIPYLPPFFTLSNRNYVIMMVCINVLLLIAIVVYAFMNKVRTDFDVVSTDSNNTPGHIPTKVESSTNERTSTKTTVNRNRGGFLNSQHSNSLSGHMYQ